MGFGGSGGSTSSIAGASDTTLNNPTNDQVLTYDGPTSMWRNAEGGEVTWNDITGKPAVIAPDATSGEITIGGHGYLLAYVKNISDSIPQDLMPCIVISIADGTGGSSDPDPDPDPDFDPLWAWEQGSLPTISGSSITTGTQGSFPTNYMAVNHDGAAVTEARFSHAATVRTRIRMYIRTPSEWPSASHAFLTVRSGGPTSTVSARASFAGSGTPGVLRFLATAGAQVSQSGNVLSLSTWYRVEMELNHDPGEGRLGLFPVVGEAPIWSSGWQSGDFLASSTNVSVGATGGATPRLGEIRLAHITCYGDGAGWIGGVE